LLASGPRPSDTGYVRDGPHKRADELSKTATTRENDASKDQEPSRFHLSGKPLDKYVEQLFKEGAKPHILRGRHGVATGSVVVAGRLFVVACGNSSRLLKWRFSLTLRGI
jgi:hypothetical protein